MLLNRKCNLNITDTILHYYRHNINKGQHEKMIVITDLKIRVHLYFQNYYS